MLACEVLSLNRLFKLAHTSMSLDFYKHAMEILTMPTPYIVKRKGDLHV